LTPAGGRDGLEPADGSAEADVAQVHVRSHPDEGGPGGRVSEDAAALQRPLVAILSFSISAPKFSDIFYPLNFTNFHPKIKKILSKL
jgi:hypothetical protein